jgi:hypothetical protein
MDQYIYTSSTSPRNSSCSMTAYGVNEMPPLRNSNVVPLSKGIRSVIVRESKGYNRELTQAVSSADTSVTHERIQRAICPALLLRTHAFNRKQSREGKGRTHRWLKDGLIVQHPLGLRETLEDGHVEVLFCEFCMPNARVTKSLLR